MTWREDGGRVNNLNWIILNSEGFRAVYRIINSYNDSWANLVFLFAKINADFDRIKILLSINGKKNAWDRFRV